VNRTLVALATLATLALAGCERSPAAPAVAAPAGARSSSASAAPAFPAPAPAARAPRRESGTRTVADAFAAHARNVVVEDSGVVAKLLRDDREGRRHQRFLVRVADGTTVLIAHNIELAPRIEPIAAGDTVAFHGEYVWNAKGGVVHWTHDDPDGRHPGGWIEVGGRRFH
jgi:uncharacterized protein DUF3465